MQFTKNQKLFGSLCYVINCIQLHAGVYISRN